jgi:hypothetical protein
MVMLGALKGKLNDEMAAPEMAEGEDISLESEGGEEAPSALAGVSDEELMAEVSKRGLV